MKKIKMKNQVDIQVFRRRKSKINRFCCKQPEYVKKQSELHTKTDANESINNTLNNWNLLSKRSFKKNKERLD